MQGLNQPRAFIYKALGNLFMKREKGVFLTELNIIDLNDGTFRLDDDLVFLRPSGEIITAQKGFVTDLFSVPTELRFLSPRVPKKGNAAAVIHDWVLAEMSGAYTHKQANLIFKEALISLGVKSWRTSIYHRLTDWYAKFEKAKDKYAWIAGASKIWPALKRLLIK